MTASPTESSGSWMPVSATTTGLSALRPPRWLGGGADHIALRLDLAHRLAAGAVMVLQPLLVAPELLFEVARRLVEARVGLGARAMRLEHEAGREMQGAVGVEAGTLLLHRDVGVHGAFEVLLLDLAGGGFRRARARRRRHRDSYR